MSDEKLSISCVCAFGLESILKREIWHLGYTIDSVNDGSVNLSGSFADVYRLNMNLRVADRVLINMGEGKAQTFDELYELADRISWEIFIEKNDIFNVTKATCVKSQLMSETDVQRITKKAIANKLMRHYNTARLPETGFNYPVIVKIKNDNVNFYINTSGDGLNKRGYRLAAGAAPIKETLAAGIILLTGFNAEKQFADVLCGSGTFVIEAAMIAAKMAPGLHRHFICEDWSMLSARKRFDVKQEALDMIVAPEIRALGSDIDVNMVRVANENAARCGVADFTSFQKMDLSEFKSRKKCGVMVVNPPYGQRLGDKRSAANVHKALSKLYASLNDWELAVITSSEDFEKDFGAKADRNRKLFNGNIKSYLYFYGGNAKK